MSRYRHQETLDAHRRAIEVYQANTWRASGLARAYRCLHINGILAQASAS